MDLVETLLLWVVGFSIVVFLVVDNLDLINDRREGCEQADERTRVYDSEKQFISENPNAQEEESDIREEGFDDDWEGIERTELERDFGEAVIFVSHKMNSDRIDRNMKLQLYGLQKVVLEGPCNGPQPMPFRFSARAKWNAWQKVGRLSTDMAMEKYVNILGLAIPGWKREGTQAIEGGSSED